MSALKRLDRTHAHTVRVVAQAAARIIDSRQRGTLDADDLERRLIELERKVSAMDAASEALEQAIAAAG